jgi:hypothetical protein
MVLALHPYDNVAHYEHYYLEAKNTVKINRERNKAMVIEEKNQIEGNIRS